MGQKTFSGKGKKLNTLGLWATELLSLFNSVATA